MIYGYIRVSSDKQTVENQRFEINRFCKSNELRIDGWIEETISGTKAYNKRELGRLLKQVQKDDLIICAELSRLGRNLFMIMEILNICMTKKFREWVLQNYNVSEIVDLNGTKVFENATVSNVILFAQHSEPKAESIISHIDETKKISHAFVQSHEDLVQDDKTLVWNLTQEKRQGNRHADMHVLGDFCYISVGMVLNADEKTAKGEFSKEDLISETKDEVHCREYIEAKDIERYAVNRVRYLEYNTDRVPDKVRRPTFRELYDRPKLICNRLGQLQMMIDDQVHYLQSDSSFICMLWHHLSGLNNKSITSSIKKFSKMKREEMEKLSKDVDLRYLLGVMNSAYAKVLLDDIRGGDYHIYPEHIRNIPIPTATPEQEQPIIDLVNQILSAKQNNPQADTSALERRIDELVYQLYGLTEDEIEFINPAHSHSAGNHRH